MNSIYMRDNSQRNPSRCWFECLGGATEATCMLAGGLLNLIQSSCHYLILIFLNIFFTYYTTKNGEVS